MRKPPNIHKMKAEKQLLEQKILQKQSQLKKLNDRIKELEQPEEITLTDHALIRYCERKLSLKIEQLRSEILTPELQEQIKTLGKKGKFLIDGLTYVVDNNKIITIY